MNPTEYLVYADDLYGHMLAAVAERYIKKKYPKRKIVYWPNKTGVRHTHLVFPTSITKKDTVWILGQSPTQRGMIDLKSEVCPAKVVWYDYHTDLIEKIFEDKESQGIAEYPGYRSVIPDLGVRIWSDLFPNEAIPPCVNWLDEYMQGSPSLTARSFVYGLELIDTDPKELNEYSAPAEDMNNPGDVWETCFRVSNPVNLDNPEREFEEDLLTRMQWDATYQIINMGSVINSWKQIETDKLLNSHRFMICSAPYIDPATSTQKKMKFLLCNCEDLDMQAVHDYVSSLGTNFDGAGCFYVEVANRVLWYHVTICGLPESGDDALSLAQYFINPYGTKDVAKFQTNILDFDDANFADIIKGSIVLPTNHKEKDSNETSS